MRPYTDHPFLGNAGEQDLSAYVDSIIAHQNLEDLLASPSLADMVEQATVNVEPHPTSLPVLDNSSNSKRLIENSHGNVGSETLLLIKVRIILSSLYPSWDSCINIIPSFLFKQRVQMAQMLLLAVLLQPKYYRLIKTTLIITQELRVTWLAMHQLKCPTFTTNINFNRHSFLKQNHQIVEHCALQPPRLLIPSTCSMVWYHQLGLTIQIQMSLMDSKDGQRNLQRIHTKGMHQEGSALCTLFRGHQSLTLY